MSLFPLPLAVLPCALALVLVAAIGAAPLPLPVVADSCTFVLRAFPWLGFPTKAVLAVWFPLTVCVEAALCAFWLAEVAGLSATVAFFWGSLVGAAAVA